MEAGLGRGRSRSGGQGPAGPWLLHQEPGAAGGHSASWRRHLVRAVVPPRLPLASPPLALRRPPLAAGPPVCLQSVCPCKPTAACVPLSRRCMPQYAVRRTSPASVAASGAQLPSPMALSCTHRSASSRVDRAPPVVASVHHSSTAGPCQVGSGSCAPRALPVHVHGGLGNACARRAVLPPFRSHSAVRTREAAVRAGVCMPAASGRSPAASQIRKV
jgi:hypothetical protein